ncbi:MAG: PAC2 family protein [Candidatus Omnitrophota bacterium]
MKNFIKITKKIKLKNPIFIAAWPGMGNVAIKTADYLIEALSAVEFADLDTGDLFYPDQAWISEGVVEIPRFPEAKFYYWKNPATKSSGSAKDFGGKTQDNDLIIFISEAQPVSEKGYFYANKIMELAESFKSQKLFTFAAMPMPVEHNQVPQVWAAATDKALSLQVRKFNAKIMDTGQISGLNGLLLAVAKERGQAGICLLGEIPLYTIQIDNPRASLAILEVLSRVLNISINLEDLKNQARLQAEEIDRLIDYFRGGLEPKEPIGEDEIERIKKSLQAFTKLPNSVKLQIEKLFEATKKDISKAQELKKELDKWSIYKEYEDRFLDLFKDKEKPENQ